MNSLNNFVKTPAQRRKAYIFVALLLSVWASWYVSQEPVPEPSLLNERSTSRQAARASAKAPVAPVPASLEWPQRSAQGHAIVDIFSLPQLAVVKPTAYAESAPLPPPVFKYKYIGRLEGSYNNSIFLSDDPSRVITAKAGQNLNDGWQLMSVDGQKLIFRHQPTGNENTMTIGSF